MSFLQTKQCDEANKLEVQVRENRKKKEGHAAEAERLFTTRRKQLREDIAKTRQFLTDRSGYLMQAVEHYALSLQSTPKSRDFPVQVSFSLMLQQTPRAGNGVAVLYDFAHCGSTTLWL